MILGGVLASWLMRFGIIWAKVDTIMLGITIAYIGATDPGGLTVEYKRGGPVMREDMQHVKYAPVLLSNFCELHFSSHEPVKGWA